MSNGFFKQNLPKKGVKQKSDHYHRILHILHFLGIKFQGRLKSLNICTKLIQKGCFWSKNETKENHYQIQDNLLKLKALVNEKLTQWSM